MRNLAYFSIPRIRTLVFATLLVSAIAVFGTMYAGIVGGGGAVVPRPVAMNSMLPGDFEDDTNIYAFNELQNVQLMAPLNVDIAAPGSYPPSALTPATIAAGHYIASHYLRYDPVNAGSSASGWVTFDNPVIGVIITNPNLAASNFLGLPGVAYPGFGCGACGMELNPDWIVLSANRLNVFVDFTASQPGDRVRVITLRDQVGGPIYD